MNILKKFAKHKNLLWFVFSLVFFVGFLALFEDVILEKSVTTFDTYILNWIYTFRTPYLNEIMKVVTSLGNVEYVAIFILVLSSILLFIKKRKYILYILASSIISEGFVFLMKILTQRPRPEIHDALIVENSFSFPSGHAMVAIAVYGLVFFFLLEISKEAWKKILVGIAGLLLVLGIGFSRIYLGVHWPTDVLASYLLGGSWVCLLLGVIKNGEGIKRLVKR